jgi:CDGSH-type Zn-finger protein
MSDSTPEPTPDVTVQPDGPYVVRSVPLVRRRTVVTEHGEPITTETTAQLHTRAVYALCRCGASDSKPFCDGSHARVGFDGTESAPASGYDDRATTYEGTRLVVRDDRSICIHAGFCGNRVTNVWNEMGGAGTEDSIVRAQVINMVERCPSGAMTYRLEADGDDIEPDLRRAIIADGPLHLTGGVSVQRTDGSLLETRNRVTLCRCGASKNKPFCDGAHRDVAFHDDGATDPTSVAH